MSRNSARNLKLNATLCTTAAIALVTIPAQPGFAADRHVVEPGDTVFDIARTYGTSVSSIVSANQLNSRALIKIGQELVIPRQQSSVALPTAPTVNHKVVSGDTLWALAQRYNTTPNAIAALNNLSNPALIRIGQVLQIPSGQALTSGPKPAPNPTPPASNTTPVDNQVEPPATATGSQEYTVRAGDSLWSLAQRFGTSVSALAAHNKIADANLIRIGQKLSIPAPGSGASSVNPEAPAGPPAATTDPKTESKSTTHVVKSGDTLSSIANRYGTTVERLVADNHITNSALIRVGQQLVVRTGGAAGLVGDSFLGVTYPQHVVNAANENKALLNQMEVPTPAQMRDLIREISRDLGVDPALSLAIAHQESGFNMRAVSPANAIGVMQVIPSSGQWASELVGRELNLLNPRDNVTAGVAILRTLQRNGTPLETAIAGYYQGETSVKNRGMFQDTRKYVANVLALKKRYQ